MQHLILGNELAHDLPSRRLSDRPAPTSTDPPPVPPNKGSQRIVQNPAFSRNRIPPNGAQDQPEQRLTFGKHHAQLRATRSKRGAKVHKLAPNHPIDATRFSSSRLGPARGRARQRSAPLAGSPRDHNPRWHAKPPPIAPRSPGATRAALVCAALNERLGFRWPKGRPSSKERLVHDRSAS
jgi:hypothetical protein